MDYAHAVVAEASLWQRGVDLTSVADEVESGNFRVGLQRSLCAFDYDPAAVVATHDIHCNSHK